MGMFKKVTFHTFEDLTNGIRSRIIKMKIRQRDGLESNIVLQSGKGMKTCNKLGVSKINQTDFQCLNEKRKLPRMRSSDDHYVFMDFTENSKRKCEK